MTTTNTPALRHCTRCDTALPAQAQFCVGCGAAMPVNSSAQPTISLREAPQAQAGTRCANCGNANPAGAGYCVNCGIGLYDAPVPTGYIPQQRMPLAPAYAGGAMMQQNIYMTAAQPAPLPLIVRALWFLFVGLWLGPLWIVAGWLLNLTLIGIPAGVWMLNRTGHVMTLKQTPPTNNVSLGRSSASMAVRAVYFVLIGWWASLIWLMFGWLLAASVIGLPIAFLMFERTGTVLTLAEG
ncbi:MAG: zinc ribbon domain-containing protein [Roseiflexaceae bacterium]|nr:zinc ribbon domain-containing protein [Roseiflexaceae bacterium]